MLDDDLNIALSDFGLAIRLHPGQSNTGRAGTPCYYPYEMVAGQAYDHRADLWCVGVLLCEMLYGILPFKSSSGPERDYSESILALRYSLPTNKNVSSSAKDLIQKLLVRQDKRLTLSQV